jgi:hypothetical protein
MILTEVSSSATHNNSHQVWCARRLKEHGSATGDAHAARRRPGTIFRGRQLGARRDTQLFQATGPPKAALSKVLQGKSRRTKKAAAAVSLLLLRGLEEQAAFKDLQSAIMR